MSDNILSPKEIEELKKKKENKHIESEPIKNEIIDNGQKYYDMGEALRINLETNGRFGNPKYIFVNHYTTKNVTSIATSKPEYLPETLVAILNSLFTDQSKIDAGELLPEEFYEILMGIKVGYTPKEASEHEHLWLCDCQLDKPQEDRKINTHTMNLADVSHTHITVADEEFSKILNKDEQIREPFVLTDKRRSKSYEFRFTRMKDIIKATRIVEDEFLPKIKYVQSKQYHGKTKEEVKFIKDIEIEKIEKDKAESFLNWVRCFSLLRVNNTELSDKRRFEEFTNKDTSIDETLTSFINSVTFGIDYQFEVKCPHCKETSKRYLQRVINPVEFLPLSESQKSDTTRKFQKHSGVDFCFG
jgi:hypothetical protein